MARRAEPVTSHGFSGESAPSRGRHENHAVVAVACLVSGESAPSRGRHENHAVAAVACPVSPLNLFSPPRANVAQFADHNFATNFVIVFKTFTQFSTEVAMRAATGNDWQRVLRPKADWQRVLRTSSG